MKKQKGITLIALVVTIIVLLILAGVSIATLTGENGIITQSNKAKIEVKRSQIKEYLGLKLIEAQNLGDSDKEKITITKKLIEKDNKNGELKQFGDNIEIGEIIEATNKIYFYVIIDKDVYEVSVEGSKYLGEQAKEDIEIQTGDIIFTHIPNNKWTNENVKVEIKANKEIEGYKLEYKAEKDDMWKTYTDIIEVETNQEIQARLSGILGNTNIITDKVESIDKLEPNTPTFGEVTSTTSSITINANATDKSATDENGSSGISGYRFSKDDGNTWTEYQESGTYTFGNLYGDVSGTSYNIQVEVKDNAGNTKATSLTAKTSINSDYYVSTADIKLCKVGDRDFYKYNNEAAIVGMAFCGGSYVEQCYVPVLVSTSYDAVKTHTTDIANGYHMDPPGGSLIYNGITYYYSTGGFWMQSKFGYTSDFITLNSPETEYTGISAYESLEKATKDLLDLYYK